MLVHYMDIQKLCKGYLNLKQLQYTGAPFSKKPFYSWTTSIAKMNEAKELLREYFLFILSMLRDQSLLKLDRGRKILSMVLKLFSGP